MTNTLALPWIGVEIDRSRRPVRYTLTAALLAFTMLISGYACNVQTWVNNAETILQEVTPAVNIVISLLPLLGTQIPSGVVNAVNQWTPKVQKDVTDLGNLIQQFQGDLANNPNAQSQIAALIATTQQEIVSILPDFNVLDKNTQAKIVDAINVVAGAIVSVENIINNIEGKVGALKASPGGYAPVKDGNAFKAQWNACMTKNFGKSAPHLY